MQMSVQSALFSLNHMHNSNSVLSTVMSIKHFNTSVSNNPVSDSSSHTSKPYIHTVKRAPSSTG